MNTTTILGLINNAALLLALGVLYDVVGYKPKDGKPVRQIMTGVILGVIGIAVMLNPWEFAPGVVFDTRSVLLSVSGLFFGAFPTLLAILMTGAFRIYTGGSGVWTGVIAILSSGAIGVGWRHFRQKKLPDLSFGECYLMGLVVHIIMLAEMLSLPHGQAPVVLSRISLPVMVIYPIATALLGYLISHQQVRSQTGEILRESEEWLRTLFESAPDGYYVTDLKGTFIAGNRAAEKLIGCEQEDLIGKSFLELNLLSPKQMPKAASLLLRNAVGASTGPDEFVLYRRDGSQVPVEISTYPVQVQGHTVVLGLARDITERKQAENALLEERTLLRTVIDNLPHSIYAKDTDSRFILSNTTLAHNVRERNPQELLGKRDFDFFPKELAEQYYADEQNLIHTGEPIFNKETPFVDSESGYRGWDSTTKVPLRNSEAEIVGIVGISIDISKQKRAEEALMVYSERLEEMVQARTRALQDAQEQLVRREKLAVLGQLAGGVGHELRNPLGAIKNATYFLNMVLENPDTEVREMLDTLDHQVGLAENIISSLLDFARTRPPVRHQVNVNAVISQALSHLSLNNSPDVEVTLQLAGDLPFIMADPDQLNQIFSNIILNGVQSMPEGGHLGIKTNVEGREWLTVSVTDTGAGISEENCGKLFEPLFTTKAKGIGLGLVVVKALVEGHGGSIAVESQVGKGSMFRVMIPLIYTGDIEGGI